MVCVLVADFERAFQSLMSGTKDLEKQLMSEQSGPEGPDNMQKYKQNLHDLAEVNRQVCDTS